MPAPRARSEKFLVRKLILLTKEVNVLELQSAPPHTGSSGPFGPGTPEESEKSPERAPRGRAPKVPKECAPESQNFKSPKRVRKSGFRLFSDSVLFPDSFRTLPGSPGPEGPGRPCVGRGRSQSWKFRGQVLFSKDVDSRPESRQESLVRKFRGEGVL